MNPERIYYKNGQVKNEVWINEAREYHRLDGPAFRWWFDDGRLEREVWFINGEYHRLDGPAYRCWCENGRLTREVWCINGELHKLDGPAYRMWYENGALIRSERFINGVKYDTEAEFQVAVDLYKANEIAELF